MSLAKSILIDELLPTFDYASKVVVRKFHSVTKDGIDTLIIDTVFDSTFDLALFSEKISEIADPINTGGTPITAAIKASINSLLTYQNSDKKIILITDGEENGGGDYRHDTEVLLRENGILFVVGIAQDEVAKVKAQELADVTGGAYIDLQSKAYSKLAVQQKLWPIKAAALNHSLRNIAKPQLEIINSEVPKQVQNEKQEEDGDKYKEERLKFEKVIQHNATAITLISKQLAVLSEEIKELRGRNNKELSEDEVQVEENAELNESVRLASERHLYYALRTKFGERVKWLNEAGETGNSHDFEVVDSIDDSIEYYIECKGSIYTEKVFYLTKNEWHLFLSNSKNYQLYFISDAFRNPQITKIDNLMDWLCRGKVVPYAGKNLKVKKERIVFTILD